MSVTSRKASSDDLGIIHDIRRDAILGISDDFGVIERQAWADRRSPEFFAERVSAGDVVLAVSGSSGAWLGKQFRRLPQRSLHSFVIRSHGSWSFRHVEAGIRHRETRTRMRNT